VKRTDVRRSLSFVFALVLVSCRQSTPAAERTAEVVVGVDGAAHVPDAPASKDLLGSRTYACVAFTMAIPAELADLQRRFATAAHDNAAWMREYAAKYPHLRPGETLPYDPHMGVSEAEYARLTDAYAHPSEMTLYKLQIPCTSRGYSGWFPYRARRQSRCASRCSPRSPMEHARIGPVQGR
jgi:hypothetical protein